MKKVLYSTSATAHGPRSGQVVSDDDRLDVELSMPAELGGDGGDGTNPEQLFAAGYSSCFFSAMKLVAAKQGIAVDGAAITAKVDLGLADDNGLQLRVELVAAVPGLDAAQTQQLMEATHQVCPYSRATRGNVDVTLTGA